MRLKHCTNEFSCSSCCLFFFSVCSIDMWIYLEKKNEPKNYGWLLSYCGQWGCTLFYLLVTVLLHTNTDTHTHTSIFRWVILFITHIESGKEQQQRMHAREIFILNTRVHAPHRHSHCALFAFKGDMYAPHFIFCHFIWLLLFPGYTFTLHWMG